jgi:adenosyl cobinamide kinase/adenosyl cobinamide phosphate guanylyltransferase
MSHPKEFQNPSDPDFDPTLDEGDGGSSEHMPDPGSTPLAFAHVPGEAEITQIVRQFFGGEIPESLRAIIASESNEIAHSTRKILEEHMRIGGILFNLRSRIEGHFVATLGETRHVRNKGAELFYRYVEKLFRKKQDIVKVYIRSYLRFSTNAGAVEMLTITDMQLLVSQDDEVIDAVIEAKRENPDLSKREVKKIIESYKTKLAEKDASLDVVKSQLSDVVGQLDDARNENQYLTEETKHLRLQIEQDKEKSKKTMVDLDGANRSVSTMHTEISRLERERDTLTRQLAEAATRVQTKEVIVSGPPENIKHLQEAADSLMNQVKEATSQMESLQAEVALLEERRKQQLAEIESKEAVERHIRELMNDFGSFMQKYKTTQLLVTAGGSVAPFANLFAAFADHVGSFHQELLAAANAA